MCTTGVPFFLKCVPTVRVPIYFSDHQEYMSGTSPTHYSCSHPHKYVPVIRQSAHVTTLFFSCLGLGLLN